MIVSSLSRHGMLILAAVAMKAAWAKATRDVAIHTLYRDNVTNAALRLHDATLDALDGAGYNRQNCAQSQQLFAAQQGVKVAFWCEPGKFRAVTASEHAPAPCTPAERNCRPSASELVHLDKRPESAGNGYSA